MISLPLAARRSLTPVAHVGDGFDGEAAPEDPVQVRHGGRRHEPAVVLQQQGETFSLDAFSYWVTRGRF